MLAKKKTISGVRSGACGDQTLKEGSKKKVCGCGAPGGCAGRLGCAPGGGGAGGAGGGAPERGAKVRAFLRLLGAHFVGQKKAAFWGALQ